MLLKVSGECFSTAGTLASVTRQLKTARRLGVRIGVVVGGGNILRGRDASGIDRTVADRAGMVATTINGTRLAERLRQEGIKARHLCAFGIPGTVERYAIELARSELRSGTVLVLSGGTGNPFFSTDSAAALRAAELDMEIILKGTDVAGVYSADPDQDPEALLYRRLSYDRALAERLAVMDLTAFAFCMEQRIPIRVFDINRPRAIIDIIKGKQIGSHIC
ncbi:MAG: UMP kinase [candidate division WOR-3 bacterium]|nr:MAG: UMP kinase [candidate division WOR-3 bacterium]